ncbi:MAG: SDR family NAD(P)-dependent oxidoreductase [Acidimicrobiales bacterium]|jgi:NAD(P)-dependent dehydrogenase (short-subunit alcohol dehydrogenase family)
MQLSGRGALVTGAGGSIGRAIAVALARQGAVLTCMDTDGDAATATASALVALGASASAVAGDVTDEGACRLAVARATELAGALHVVVNAAGDGAMGRSEAVPAERWRRVVDVNLTGTFLVCREAIPALVATGGSIVNIASSGGLKPTAYNAAYCASKAGVVMLTKTLAVELSDRGVRANCVCPGSVDTAFLRRFVPPEDANMTLLARNVSLLGRPVTVEEVADAVVYLASDAAAMVTGTVLSIDGGAST